MSAHRFFLTAQLPDGDPVAVPLSDADLHHATGVLRLRAGEAIEAVEPEGGVWRLVIERAGPEGLVARREAPVHSARVPDLTLVQGVAKGEKMEAIVRQAVEVGATRIIPVLTERTIVRLDARKAADRAERWRRIAKSAAEQAHRDSVPPVDQPAPLDASALVDAHDLVVVLWEDEAHTSLATALAAVAGRESASVAVVVGPEGGLSAGEVAALVEAGAVTAGLGPTILRTETAAVAGLALASHLLGGLGA